MRSVPDYHYPKKKARALTLFIVHHRSYLAPLVRDCDASI